MKQPLGHLPVRWGVNLTWPPHDCHQSPGIGKVPEVGGGQVSSSNGGVSWDPPGWKSLTRPPGPDTRNLWPRRQRQNPRTPSSGQRCGSVGRALDSEPRPRGETRMWKRPGSWKGTPMEGAGEGEAAGRSLSSPLQGCTSEPPRHANEGDHIPAYSSIPTEQESGPRPVQRGRETEAWLARLRQTSTFHSRCTGFRTSCPEGGRGWKGNAHTNECAGTKEGQAENVS